MRINIFPSVISFWLRSPRNLEESCADAIVKLERAEALAHGERVPTVALHQRDMLRLATIDGARVWSLDSEAGSLTPGKQADIAVVDMRSPHNYELVGSHLLKARDLMHASRKKVLERFEKQPSTGKPR